MSTTASTATTMSTTTATVTTGGVAHMNAQPAGSTAASIYAGPPLQISQTGQPQTPTQMQIMQLPAGAVHNMQMFPINQQQVGRQLEFKSFQPYNSGIESDWISKCTTVVGAGGWCGSDGERAESGTICDDTSATTATIHDRRRTSTTFTTGCLHANCRRRHGSSATAVFLICEQSVELVFLIYLCCQFKICILYFSDARRSTTTADATSTTTVECSRLATFATGHARSNCCGWAGRVAGI